MGVKGRGGEGAAIDSFVRWQRTGWLESAQPVRVSPAGWKAGEACGNMMTRGRGGKGKGGEGGRGGRRHAAYETAATAAAHHKQTPL